MKQFWQILIWSLVIIGCTHAEPQDSVGVEANNEKKVTAKKFPSQKMDELQTLIKQGAVDSSFLEFYQNRKNYVWFNSELELTSEANALILLLENAGAYGIDSAKYKLGTIKKKIAKNTVEEAELLLTQNYTQFGKQISFGQIEDVKDYYKFERRKVDTNWLMVLSAGIQKEDVIGELLSLQPQNDEYIRLQKGLENYLKRVQLSDTVIKIKSYREDSLKTYHLARKALVLHGILKKDSVSDSLLIDGIKRFQYEHGLEPDGVIGRGTAKTLSKSTNHFYQQARVALEKWRWIKPFEERHIFVNIATYKMKCYVNNKIEHEKRVVVGTNTTRTPELDSKLDYMIAYPYWHVPRSIIEGELVAKAKKDSTYLSRNGYELFKGGSAVNSKTIDWSQGSNYKFRQKGGRSNALGVVKFIFPNKHSVYFHDTPSKRFFQKGRRAYSHGCVRVHEPLQLAAYLLEKDSVNKYSIDSVKTFIKNRKRKVVTFNKKMPVHIRYCTVEADTNHQIRFYPDVYFRESELMDFAF
ncbi:MAG: L,D-transpeptidase family protein [Flavobacteriales bacterium]|jgi:murein L,D-transpeptidase YcbB/YkuD|nr:L,D-transpeptidase family protein [Flavobacteriales bacterium]